MNLVGKQFLVLLVLSNVYCLFQISVLRQELASEKEVNSQADRLHRQLGKSEKQRDQLFKQVIVLTDQVQQTQGEVRRLVERNARLLAELAAQKKELKTNSQGVPPTEIRRKSPLPEIPKIPQLQTGERGKIATK